MIQEHVLRDIAAERERQDKQWGGATHDDSHVEGMWTYLIDKFAMRANRLMNARGAITSRQRRHYREHLVKIAALTVAAIESHDRKTNSESEDAS